MRKSEKATVINFRLPMGLSVKIEEYVEKYHYKTLSDFLRIGCEQLIKYHDYEERFEDPEVREEFFMEIDPKILKLSQDNAMKSYFDNLSQKDLERFYYLLSQERHQRLEYKIKTKNDKQTILKCGGELEPKVGYKLSSISNIEFYKPITPDSNEWDNLTKEDKSHLLLELKQKRIELESIIPEPENGMLDYRFSYIDRIIDEISKRIDNEL